MSLRGAKKLQMIALVLYAAALGATLLYIPTQSFWKRSAAVSPEAIACVTVPVSSLIGAALRLVLAAVWLACLRGVKDKPLKGSVIALSILLGAYAIAVEPITPAGKAAVTSAAPPSKNLKRRLACSFSWPAISSNTFIIST